MSAFSEFAAAAAAGIQFHFRRYYVVWLFFIVSVTGITALHEWVLSPPASFPVGTIIVIEKGSTAVSVARELSEAGLLKHPRVLEVFLRLSGADDSLRPGPYRFSSPQNALSIGVRLSLGDFGIPATRLTFIEGSTVRDMAAKIASTTLTVSRNDFISAAGPYEGYLFPDTYTFQPDATAESIVKDLRANFEENTKKFMQEAAEQRKSFSSIIVMASIIEKEARLEEERHMISGILWNRIARGMPLQVDAVFGYIFGRNTYSPSFEDLTVDSPYNTYKNKGLPPGPINNPGSAAIDAALHPTKSNYLFYLTGRDGVTRYAATYAEHIRNQERYLR